MPMQEFLASYAVQVDEDGARRLQAILDQNRESGGSLAAAFSSARDALAGLKRELAETSGLRDALAGLFSGSFRVPTIPVAGPAASVYPASGFPVGDGLTPGGSRLSVGADFSPADEALSEFRSRLEAERPRLSVNPSGITSAVSTAAASVRTQLSALRITVPVTAVPTLDTSGLPTAAQPGTEGAAPPQLSANRSGPSALPGFSQGGRVQEPAAILVAEKGSAEYVIPTDDDRRAAELLRALLAEMSESFRQEMLEEMLSGMSAGSAANAAGLEAGGGTGDAAGRMAAGEMGGWSEADALREILGDGSSLLSPREADGLAAALRNGSGGEAVPGAGRSAPEADVQDAAGDASRVSGIVMLLRPMLPSKA